MSLANDTSLNLSFFAHNTDRNILVLPHCNVNERNLKAKPPGVRTTVSFYSLDQHISISQSQWVQEPNGTLRKPSLSFKVNSAGRATAIEEQGTLVRSGSKKTENTSLQGTGIQVRTSRGPYSQETKVKKHNVVRSQGRKQVREGEGAELCPKP